MDFPESPVPPQLSAEGERLVAERSVGSTRPQPRKNLLDRASSASSSQTPSATATSWLNPMLVSRIKTRLVHVVDISSRRMPRCEPAAQRDVGIDLASVELKIQHSCEAPQVVDDHLPNVVEPSRHQKNKPSINDLHRSDDAVANLQTSTPALVRSSSIKYIPKQVRFPELFVSQSCTAVTAASSDLLSACGTTVEINMPSDLACDSTANVEHVQPNSSMSNGQNEQNDGDVVGTERPVTDPANLSKERCFSTLPCLTINGQKYSILKEIGQGGSSKVFEVYNGKLLAIKCVDLRGADETVRDGYLNEISMLERLQHSRRVIRFHHHEYNRDEGKLYVVMERGDVDMATFIHNEAKDGGITPDIVNCYWAEMVRAVRDIHRAGIIHSDLKPANFLLVAGKLKLIDFGIASAIPKDMTSVIKDVKCGTPNYISPEALMEVENHHSSTEDGDQKVKIKIGVKSDVWSLGCILYHMVYGRTPFQHLNKNLRLLAIVDSSFKIQFPPVNDELVLDILKKCIVRDVNLRASVDELLNHPYIPRGYKPAPS